MAIEEMPMRRESLPSPVARLQASRPASSPSRAAALKPSQSASLRSELIRALIVLGAILLELVLADLLPL